LEMAMMARRSSRLVRPRICSSVDMVPAPLVLEVAAAVHSRHQSGALAPVVRRSRPRLEAELPAAS
jgi:hypothetical protein